VEGLLIDAEVRRLAPRLPAARLTWRFDGPATLVLPLVPQDALVIDLHPTAPRCRVGAMPPELGGPVTSFQRTLHARATGRLAEVSQSALDRRFTLRFEASEGFVPNPAVDLVIELTGRNANAVLLAPDARIVAVHREVDASMNRRRQLRPGLAYRPPPPYDKLDPRGADAAIVTSVLRAQPLRSAHRRIDGIGAVLTRAWARLAAVDPDEPLEGESLERAVRALAQLVEDPLAAERLVLGDAVDPGEHGRAARRAQLEHGAQRALARRRGLLERRLADTQRALSSAGEAAALRGEADLLLAHAHEVPRGAEAVRLRGFDGRPVTLSLDPARDPAGNARARYDAARRREARAERARAQQHRVEAELAAVAAAEAGVPDASDEALAALVDTPRRSPSRTAAPPGLRVAGPHGFEVVIGRSARENELVTFKVARSDDLWLHAQGYYGAHVVVRSQGREVPAETLRFAAELAAGHSEARASDNVPVDYTRRKHVWKVRGGALGAVHYSQQRTVFVTPRRRSEVE
jgi:predicted ribosome quality control (RQC) complex YloA/Tae2 family protein